MLFTICMCVCVFSDRASKPAAHPDPEGVVEDSGRDGGSGQKQTTAQHRQQWDTLTTLRWVAFPVWFRLYHMIYTEEDFIIQELHGENIAINKHISGKNIHFCRDKLWR